MPDMEKTLADAMNCVRERISDTINDPTRPKYHFASPAGNMLDTWGAFCHKGEYHLFYDINADNSPLRDWGFFGHIKSRNLVNWHHLPLALGPEPGTDEFVLNDGCIDLDGNGVPIMWYTRDFNGKKAREHIPVRGDDDMIKWERIKDVPPLTLENHGGPEFNPGWSDPIIFHENGESFMLISKCVTLDGRGVIPIYKATDDTLLSWEYKGIFLDETGEVLNFIKIGEKWVLIHSPYNNPVWIVGSFDEKNLKFVPENRGMLSFGYVKQGVGPTSSRGFYATTAISDPKSLIFGWVSGFDAPTPTTWMGAIGIPRTLSLGEDNRLLMVPAEELKVLRKNQININSSGIYTVSNAFEMTVEFDDFAETDCFELYIGDTQISVAEKQCILRDITVSGDEYKKLCKLHLFVDVSIAELFLNDGMCSITRCIPALSDEVCVKIVSTKEFSGSIWNLELPDEN